MLPQASRAIRGDEEGVAELNGPDRAGTRADTRAGERAEHSAAQFERERGAAQGGGRPQLPDPVERDEGGEAEGHYGADDLDEGQYGEQGRSVGPAATRGCRRRGGTAPLVAQEHEARQERRRDEQRGRPDAEPVQDGSGYGRCDEEPDAAPGREVAHGGSAAASRAPHLTPGGRVEHGHTEA